MLSKTIFATAILALATSVAAAPTPAPVALAQPDLGSDIGNLLSPGSSDSALNGNTAEGNGDGSFLHISTRSAASY
ncbi:unnamed protein product [Aureobasidium vineae]|uniref:Secreted protein n=1 Tax=Aureobasidium vineae TaxID=2773715 RepID=A0A9N8JG63_9PEZI|nr:unnamed protein product [Aureobasidium vineae]